MWMAIEDTLEAAAVLGEAAHAGKCNLYARTWDLFKWFRMLATALPDRWKSQINLPDGYREDRRTQMGRAASAHIGQRVAMLIVQLLREAGMDADWGLMDARYSGLSEEQHGLQKWISQRRAVHLDPDQSALVWISSFQDDIAVLAVGMHAAETAERILLNTCAKFSVRLSQKPHAKHPFSTIIESLGARFDLTETRSISCRPTQGTVGKLFCAVRQLEGRAGLPMPVYDLQDFAGLLLFASRFTAHGRFHMNSVFAALATAQSPTLHGSHTMMTLAMIRDACVISNALLDEQLPPPMRDPAFMHPGRFIADADAAGADARGKRGYGFIVGFLYAHGVWPTDIADVFLRQELSIAPLELLALAALVNSGLEDDVFPTIDGVVRVLVRGDNDSACHAVNANAA